MSSPSTPNELRAAVAALRPYFVRCGWFSLVTALLVVAPSGYMLEVYGRVVTSRSYMTLAMLTLLVLGAYVVMELVEMARGEVMEAAGRALDDRLAPRLFGIIFDGRVRGTGSGSQLPLSDLKTVREFLTSPAMHAILEAPVALIMAVLLFLISPWLGWTAIVFGILQTGVAWLNERATHGPFQRATQMAHAAQRQADDTLRNAEVIESMGMLRQLYARWLQRQRDFLGMQAQASESAGGFQALAKLLQNLLSSTLLGLACWLLLHNELHGGGAMMIIGSILGGRMLAPLVQLVGQWQTVVQVRGAWQRLGKLLQQIPAPQQAMPLPPPRGLVLVQQLSAGAPVALDAASTPQQGQLASQSLILRGIDFALQPGDGLAIVGPSASGKSTLARLLVGLWPAAAGSVRLEGASVHAWDKAQLGPYLGYLPQTVDLFEGTVAENIARFGAVDPVKVQAAAREVGLLALIESLPQGFDTPLGPGGARLSGGQRQRVGLARALYGDPVLVVLDEPNSSLDDEGDAALNSAIAAARARGTTVAVVTHRTSVLASMNKLLLLRDGLQVGFGPRDEVMAAIRQAQQGAAAPQGPDGPAIDAEAEAEAVA
ncbi:type I secretion system permease/ATPase [Acidovorax sp. SRB_24]|uniref:type I secretion system permease/ATPase n=1 Tax=Acidovorax sp. SRB_24 TaxID=1962700 RepID=UPI00145E3D5E|nr:type I secretion system permease/ATPase [Acidovorax sp. SRB_24]NMM78532.1 type I secretion system permease/ATPase [Acidovorax sp. SRB_24]